MGNISGWLNSLFPLIAKGGWVMWPIVLLSIAAFSIILERLWFMVVRADRIVPRSFLAEVDAKLGKGEIEEAVVLCRKDGSMMARVLYAGLSFAGSPRSVVREALEDAGRRETRELDRFLGTLSAIAGVAPLLGFLGTVLGMVQIFQEISQKHIGQYEALAGGIYVALYTTVAGLVVAIPAYLAYRAFAGIADRKRQDMEDWAVDLMNKLDKATGGKGNAV